MKRTKLKDRILPSYTKGEEIFNMTSHIAGGADGVVALCLCVIFSALHKDAYAVVSSAIYGTTIIILYTMSSIYHGMPREKMAKKFANAREKRKPTVYQFQKRERKANPTKGGIIAELAKFLEENSEFAVENVEITNKERQIAFKIGENAFELTLTQKRKPKT